MELVTPGIGLIFWTTIVFIILLILLKKFAWKPILTAVKEREDRINNAVHAAELAMAEVEKVKEDSEKYMQEARLERDRILKAAREAHEKMIVDAKETSAKRVAGIVERARQTINNERMAAIVDLKNQVADVSIDVAEKLLKEKLSTKAEHKALVDKLVEEINLG